MSEIGELEAEKRRLQLQNNNNHDNIMNDINDSLKRMSPTKPSNSTAPAAIPIASKVARSPRKSPQSKPSEKKMRSNESSKSGDEEAIAPVINRASTLQSAPFAQQVRQPYIGANISWCS